MGSQPLRAGLTSAARPSLEKALGFETLTVALVAGAPVKHRGSCARIYS
jgi:hypothetical protein